MSDLSRTAIDGLGALGTISDEDAAKLPATTRMFLEASPDWEKRARGWWRKGIEGGRDVHYWDLGDACLGMAKPSAALVDLLRHQKEAAEMVAAISGIGTLYLFGDLVKPLTATAAAALQRARNEAQRHYNAICSRNRVVYVEPQPFSLPPVASERPALRFNRIKPHEDTGTDWMAGLHMGGPR